MNWNLLKEYGVQCFIAFDQLANALIPPIDGTVSYAAGTRTAAVSWGYIHPDDNPAHWGADVLVDHPLELRAVLDRALCGC